MPSSLQKRRNDPPSSDKKEEATRKAPLESVILEQADRVSQMRILNPADIALIADRTTDGITVQDTRGQVVYANAQAAALVGFDSPEALCSALPQEIMSRFDLMNEVGAPLPLSELPGRKALQGEEGTLLVRSRIRATGEEQWSMVRASPLRNPDGGIRGAINFFQDITEQKRQERQSAFLAESTSVLSSSLEMPVVLSNIARLAVPHLADWCSINLRRANGSIENIAVMHLNPKKEQWVREYQRLFPIDHNYPSGTAAVIRTGKSEWVREVTPALIAAANLKPDQRQVLGELGLRSVITVPIIGHDTPLGAISFLRAETGSLYDEKDLAFAEDFGRRVGLAVENAQLYTAAQQELAERKQAEQALRVSDERYRAFLRHSTEGIWRYELETPIAVNLPEGEQIERAFADSYLGECNDAMAQMYGYRTATELVGCRLGDLLVRSDPTNIEYLRAFIRSGYRLTDTESHEVDKDGNNKYFLSNLAGVIDNGFLVCVWGTKRDITEDKKSKERMEQLVRELKDIRFAIDQSSIVAMTDHRGKITMVNDKFCEISKYSREELIGKDHSVINSKCHPPAFIAKLWETITSGRVWHGEIRNRAKDGRIYWVDTTIVPFLDPNGNVNQFVAIRNDITEQKEAEEMIRTLNTKLERKVHELYEARMKDRANLERIKQMISNMPLAAIAGDEHMKVLHVNDRFCEMFRLKESPEELVGMDGMNVVALVRDKLLESDEQIRKLIEMLQEKKPVTDKEVPLLDGRILSKDYIPIFENGQHHGHLLLYRDVTQERRLDRTKSEFMSLASHQLRTPLTSIRWTLGSLEKSLKKTASPVQRELLIEGRQASARMSRTIDTMLQISRIESGQVHPQKQEIQLLPILRELAEGFDSEYRRREQHMRVDCPEELTLRTDVALLHETLTTLLSNAIKYTPAGGTIVLRAQSDAKRTLLSVEDNGCGIPLRDQDKIFHKFFRGKNVQATDTDGTGLGLYLASLLTGLLGGTITLDSKEGAGTRFIISFPAQS